VARSRRPVTSAARTGRPVTGRARAERVEALLARESLDTSRLSYDFDGHHVGLVAAGHDAQGVVEDRVGGTDGSLLLMEARGGVVWAWMGKRQPFDPAEVEALASGRTATDLRLAIGEPAQGLAGWRLTHHQARAALAVAECGGPPVVRYSEVAMLTAAVRDELLATSLCRLYLDPLADGRDGGEELRRTLRAYFDADRNVSVAGDAIGVTRQAVARRLRAVEKRLGRSIAACGADLEVALRLDALEAAPTRRPAP
jgi:hypothetical protein